MRFLHTADWQWGMPARFLTSDETRARYDAARFAAVRRIGAIARQESCEFVVVCGDVYDANQLSHATILRSLEALRAIDIPVYLLPGNHDPYDPGSIYRTLDFARVKDSVHVLSEPGIHRVSDGVELVAAPWLTKRPVEDLVGAQLDQLAPTSGGLVRILVGHGALDIRTPDKDLPHLIRAARLRAALDDRRVHYVALGDRHSRTELEMGGRAWYSGTPEVTDYDEDEPGKILVVDLDDQDCHVTTHTVGVWAFRKITENINGTSDIEALDRKLSSMPNKDTTAVRLSLRGTLSLRERALLDECIAEHAHVFGHLAQWDRYTDLAVLPADGEVDDLHLSGYAAAAFDELKRLAEHGGANAACAQDALRLFYRLNGTAR